MFGWFKKRKPPESDGLRAVPGAGVYQSADARVDYNMLDPWMQQFMGRCVGAVKKAGIRAKGTGQFSILLGDDQRAELQLDEFWRELANSKDAAVFERVAAAARAKFGDG
jgi:hypothetical protein